MGWARGYALGLLGWRVRWLHRRFGRLDGVKGVVLRGQGRTHQPNTHCVPGEPQVKRTRLKRWNFPPRGKIPGFSKTVADTRCRGEIITV